MATQSAAISGAMMDAQLWQSGAASPKLAGSAIELDFLRGIHNPISLKALQMWLQSHTNNHIRLTSVWLDKYGNVVPASFPAGLTYNYQELADLAIFVRDAKDPFVDEWMWLLQGKVTQSKLAKLPASVSTPREIHLFESMPVFKWHGNHSLGHNFNLRSDFAGPMVDYKHWSFLCFEADTQAACYPQFISARWPGTLSIATQETSFSDELAEIVRHFSIANPPHSLYGAPLGLRNPNWDDLATQILYRAAAHPRFGHASNIRKKQSDVLISALYAESYGTWAAVNGGARARPISDDAYFWHYPHQMTNFTKHMERFGVSAFAISTGFLRKDLAFVNTTEKMIQRLEEKLRASDHGDRGERGGGTGGTGKPNGAGDNEGDEGGGAKLTLFVDVYPGD